GIANYPVILLFAQDDPGSIEVWTSMVFSLTDGHLFDDSLNPVFNKGGSAAAKTIDWISGALNTSKILDPASLTSQEIPVVKAMESGAHTFKIGRASCRERVQILGGEVAWKDKKAG